MVYSRGHPRDYDDWAAAGAIGWSYAEGLPYFTRSENNQDYPTSVYHGRGGPMNVSTPGPPNPLNQGFIDSALALGFPACADLTGPNPEGVRRRQGTIRDGRRETTARAFLAPARRNGNLIVMTDALATRILIDNGRATGVAYTRGNVAQQVRATREIILAAGSLQTPQLLLLSGVGDAGELQALGLAPVHDLPGVGRNLHDHLACPVVMSTRDTTSYGLSWRTVPRETENCSESSDSEARAEPGARAPDSICCRSAAAIAACREPGSSSAAIEHDHVSACARR